MAVIETLGAVVTIASAVELLWKILKSGGKTIKLLNKLIRKTKDPTLKKLLIQKRGLEGKEMAIVQVARKVLIQLEKQLKKKKTGDAELESTQETVALIKSLGDHIGQLKVLKKIKLNLQKRIYSTSKKLRGAKDDVISIKAVAKEIEDLELQLQGEEQREAQMEEIIAQVILRLKDIKGVKVKKKERLTQLLQDFVALGKLSKIERHVDTQIHALIEVEIASGQTQNLAA